MIIIERKKNENSKRKINKEFFVQYISMQCFHTTFFII